jgi:F-type H+-transporting ATPase subunit b
VSGILHQLELDQSFFYQLALFSVVFFVMRGLYFKPITKLFNARHKRLIEDREAAEALVSQADQKLEEYKRRLTEERVEARKQYDAILADTRKEEAQILNTARNEAKKITQEAVESINKQREQIKKQLEADVEGLAKNISDTLLARKD